MRDEKNPNAHHPLCEFVTWEEVSKDWVENWPDDLSDELDMEFAKTNGVMRCHADCPSMAEAITLGRELAARYGW